MATGVGRATLLLVVGRLGSRALDLIVLAVLARQLGASAFGVVAAAAAILAFLDLLRDGGLTQAIVARGTPRIGELRALTTVSWCAGLLLSVVMLAAGLGLAKSGVAPLGSVIAAMSPILLLLGLGLVPVAILQREMRSEVLAGAGVLAAVVGGAVALAGVGLGLGVFALALKAVVEALVASVTCMVFVRISPTFDVWRTGVGSYVRVGIPILGSRILETVQGRGDDLIVGRFMGSEALGIYSLAYRLYRVVTEVFLGSLSQVLLPKFVALQSQRHLLLQAYYESIVVSSVICIPIFVGLAAVADGVIGLLFGPAWAPAVPVMQWLASVGVLHSIRYFDATLLIAQGGERLALQLRLVTVGITLAGFFAVAPHGSLVLFVAVYAGVGWLVSAPCWLLALHRSAGVEISKVARGVSGPLFASLGMSACIIVVPDVSSEVADLAIRCLVGALSYIALLAVMDKRSLVLAVHRFRQLGGS